MRPTGTGKPTRGARDRPREQRLLPVLVALLVAAVVLAAFAPALRAGFLNWDDPQNLLGNPHFRGFSREHLAWMLTTSWLGPYQPLSWLSLAVDHALWGLSGPETYPEAGRYHLTSVLLHAGATAVFACFAARLFARALPSATPRARWLAAALAGLLFGAHPLRAESVAWVTERRDVLSGLFLALALSTWTGWVGPRAGARANTKRLALAALGSAAAAGAFFLSVDLSRSDALSLRRGGQAGLVAGAVLLALSAQLAARAEEGAPRARRFHLALLWFLLSLLSKGTSLTVPLALLVLDAWPFGRLEGATASRSICRRAADLVLEKSPWFALSAVFGALAVWGQSAQGTALVSWTDHTLGERLVQCLYGLAWYPWKTLAPLALVPIVELPPKLSLAEPRFLAAAVAVAVAAPTLLALRRRGPAAVVSLLAFAILIAPVLGLTQAGPQLVADRYSYVSCLPFAALGAGSLAVLAQRRPRIGRAVLLFGAVWALALGTLTFRQASFWRSSEALWEHALAANPRGPAAHQFLGIVRRDQGLSERDPARKRERFHEARALFERGMELGQAPSFLSYQRDVHVTLAGLEPEARAEHAERAIECSRRSLEAARRLGRAPFEARLDHAQLLLAFERAPEAVRMLMRLAQERPQRAEAWSLLGHARLAVGQAEDAIAALEEALRLDPAPAATWLALARASAAHGDHERAVSACGEVLLREPGSLAARDLLKRLGE